MIVYTAIGKLTLPNIFSYPNPLQLSWKMLHLVSTYEDHLRKNLSAKVDKILIENKATCTAIATNPKINEGT